MGRFGVAVIAGHDTASLTDDIANQGLAIVLECGTDLAHHLVRGYRAPTQIIDHPLPQLQVAFDHPINHGLGVGFDGCGQIDGHFLLKGHLQSIATNQTVNIHDANLVIKKLHTAHFGIAQRRSHCGTVTGYVAAHVVGKLHHLRIEMLDCLGIIVDNGALGLDDLGHMGMGLCRHPQR